MLRVARCLRCSQKAAGYGPFSAEAKARQRRAAQQPPQEHPQDAMSPASSSASSAASPNMMQHMGIETNLNLRLSLAALNHPSTMRDEVVYRTPEWKRGVNQLYRTILRLHNTPVAVSLEVSKSRTGGPSAAVAHATGVSDAEAKFLGTSATSATARTPCQTRAGDEAQAEPTDYMLRYLLTPQQRLFGNKFVHEEFRRHMDADAVTAVIFYEGWYQYVLQLASGVTARELSDDEKRLLSPEQKEKLDELRGSLFSMRAENEPGFLL